MDTKKELTAAHPCSLSEEEFDGFIIALIDKLRSTKDPLTVAEVKDFYLSPEFNELLSFVGITSKQVNTTALFAWTESVNSKLKDGCDDSKK